MASRIGSRARMILAARAGDPLPALALPDRDQDRPAVHDLAEAPALAEQEGAFLDRGAVGGRAGRHRRLAARRPSTWARLTAVTMAAGKPVQRLRQQALDGHGHRGAAGRCRSSPGP